MEGHLRIDGMNSFTRLYSSLSTKFNLFKHAQQLRNGGCKRERLSLRCCDNVTAIHSYLCDIRHLNAIPTLALKMNTCRVTTNLFPALVKQTLVLFSDDGSN